MPDDTSSHRNVSRRKFITTSAVGASVGIAGCTGGDTGKGDDSTPEEKDTAKTGGASKNAQNATKLVFWHQESVPQRVQTMEKFIKQFNKEHDNIQVVQEPQSWNKVFGKLTSALEAGNEPDFMFSLPAFTMTFQSRGDLVDVSDIVKDIDKKHDLYGNTISPFKYDGGTWGIPMWDMVFLNHFRSDTLGKTQGWPPKNWDEWFQAAKTVTNADNNKYGIVLPANKNLWTTENLYTLMINAGAYVYGPDGKVMFNTKETVQTLDFYKRMFNQASPPGATNWGWAQWERSLLQGTAHSTIGFSSWIQRLQETDLAGNFSANQQPYPSNGQQGSVHYVNDIMVFNEKKKDAIGTFVKWMHQQGTYGQWLANLEPTLYLPVTKTGENSKEFWKHDLISKYESMVKAQFKALPHAGLYGFREIHNKNDLYIPSVGKLEGSNVLGSIVQQLVVNDKSPEQAAKWGQKRLQEVLGVGKSSKL